MAIDLAGPHHAAVGTSRAALRPLGAAAPPLVTAARACRARLARRFAAGLRLGTPPSPPPAPARFTIIAIARRAGCVAARDPGAGGIGRGVPGILPST
jgi:hypothetical protein